MEIKKIFKILSVILYFLAFYFFVKNTSKMDDFMIFRILILFLGIASYQFFCFFMNSLDRLERKKDIKIFLSININNNIKKCLKRLELDVLNEEETHFDVKKLMKLNEDDFSDVYYVFRYVEEGEEWNVCIVIKK